MIQTSKNTKDQIFQNIPTFAGELDRTKVYLTLSDLQSDILNKKYIYPGKIVYVFETKKLYEIDLEINGSSVFTPSITSLWKSHINTLIGNKDLKTSDYELPGYTNTWVYRELLNNNFIEITGETGYIPVSNNGSIDWRQYSITYNGDISDSTYTEIVRFSYIDVLSAKMFIFVNGEEGINVSNYTSTISFFRENNTGVYMNEYGVVTLNNLDIDINIELDIVSDEWVVSMKKNSSIYTIINTEITIQKSSI